MLINLKMINTLDYLKIIIRIDGVMSVEGHEEN